MDAALRRHLRFDAFSRGKEGDSLDGNVRTANDILFNPDGTIERVEREYERHAESETDTDGQTGLESQVALAQIEQVSEDVREKAESFEEREALLRERFAGTADQAFSETLVRRLPIAVYLR